MIEPNDFRETIVEPAIARFVSDPASLVDAATVIWAIDALASHVALVRGAEAVASGRKSNVVEEDFKKSLGNYEKTEHRAFQLIREASNALKHGQRIDRTNVAPTSSVLRCMYVDRAAAYYQFDLHVYYGNQAVLDLNVEWRETAPGQGEWVAKNHSAVEEPSKTSKQTFNYRTLWGLIEPAMKALGYPAPEGSPRVPPQR